MLHVDGDASLNAKLLVTDDASLNKSLYVKETLHIDGDASLNAKLLVADDVSLNADLFVSGNMGINTHPSSGIVLDINSTNAIRLPKGQNIERPIQNGDDPSYKGLIRYNSEQDQFEGFGAGNAWGSLGGVKDVDQDTYIIAETSAGVDNDQLQFYTGGDQRMIIDATGDVSFNHGINVNGDASLNAHLFVADDVSFNKDLYVKENLIVDGNVSLKQFNNEYIVNTHTTNYDLIVAEDLSVNGNLFISGDVSLNSKLVVADDVSLNTNLSVGGNITGTLVTPNQANITTVGQLTSLVSIGDVSLNNQLYIGGDLSLSGHIRPSSHGTINMGSNSLKFNEIHGVTASLDSLTIDGDLSLNNRLFVSNDASFNGKVFLGGTLIASKDVSFNDRLFVQNDVSLNSNLYVGGDLSWNPSNIADNSIPNTAIIGFTGIIVMWSGDVANIPTGWVICDGTNNTPDLRSKFIIGFDSRDTSFNIDSSGGSFLAQTDAQLPRKAFGLGTVNDNMEEDSLFNRVYYSLAYIMKT